VSEVGVDEQGSAQGRPEGAAETTVSLDAETLAEQLDAAQPDPARGDVRILAVTRGPGAGSRYRIDEPEVRIGRHPEAHVLLDDVTVSRRHALLTVLEDQVVLTDQASLNGTYVAGERVDSHVLQDGDEIQIGRFHLVFLEGPSADEDGTDGV
jgi:pSer/pThr/pTyr-binding forkhead associated (FHA) protein